MRKSLLIVAGGVFALGMAAGSFAAPKQMVARGTITAVDSAAKTVTVKEGRQAVTYTVASAAKIVESNKAMTVADLKTNERVIVHYTVANGAKVADQLDVMPPHTHHATKHTAAH